MCLNVQVEVKGKRGKPSVMVTEDEEFKKVNFDKFAKLPTVFQVSGDIFQFCKTKYGNFQRDGGTVTAGNASTLSDGAAATVIIKRFLRKTTKQFDRQVLMTADKAAEMGCTPLAKVVGYADGATDPIDFPIAPKFALDKLMAQVI